MGRMNGAAEDRNRRGKPQDYQGIRDGEDVVDWSARPSGLR